MQAVFRSRSLPAFGGYGDGLFRIDLPPQLSLSQVAAALRCPCQFLLGVLLAVTELPEIEAGLDPRERGELLHRVLARFTADYQEHLDQGQPWDGPGARERLEEMARRLLTDLLPTCTGRRNGSGCWGRGGFVGVAAVRRGAVSPGLALARPGGALSGP